eukprot:CAMPEP_0168474246 /NCGR_PEP_ID=MMETSP0228-20121227/60743_1 /TAXON_ID=133427 /ORGANISM="Protoceratium reticulatum, Strain CCCM 535 (=CCMP 1889)" /LENGTH=32 /DNA_ID= /DNA_START= /DNA_END= /DNA_ORIENTATION=
MRRSEKACALQKWHQTPLGGAGKNLCARTRAQ